MTLLARPFGLEKLPAAFSECQHLKCGTKGGATTSVKSKKSPNVYKSCPKIISLKN